MPHTRLRPSSTTCTLVASTALPRAAGSAAAGPTTGRSATASLSCRSLSTYVGPGSPGATSHAAAASMPASPVGDAAKADTRRSWPADSRHDTRSGGPSLTTARARGMSLATSGRPSIRAVSVTRNLPDRGRCTTVESRVAVGRDTHTSTGTGWAAVSSTTTSRSMVADAGTSIGSSVNGDDAASIWHSSDRPMWSGANSTCTR